MIARSTRKGKSYIVGYHTQEFREKDQPLSKPIKCSSNESWLGFGYYFWAHIEFAHYWGRDAKRKTGYYDIYKAEIEESNLLNASFSEEGYSFFKQSVEMVIERFKSEGIKISLSEVQRYLVDNFWPNNDVKGVIYDDLPTRVNHPDGRTYSVIPPLFYKKRIQIVVFSVENISNFEIELEAEPC